MSQHFLCSKHLRVLSQPICTTALGGGCYYYTHFTDEEITAQRDQGPLVQSVVMPDSAHTDWHQTLGKHSEEDVPGENIFGYIVKRTQVGVNPAVYVRCQREKKATKGSQPECTNKDADLAIPTLRRSWVGARDSLVLYACCLFFMCKIGNYLKDPPNQSSTVWILFPSYSKSKALSTTFMY